MMRFSSNELSSIRNTRNDERLHHMASVYHEKPEEKRLTRTKEIVKITLNFDETGRDLNILHFARFKYMWKWRQGRAYISNFIKIGQCAPLVPCVHLLDLFWEKWLLRGGWFCWTWKGLPAAAGSYKSTGKSNSS